MNDSQRKVLCLLEAAGERGVTTKEMVQLGAGNRFSARLLELRGQGYAIRVTRERESSFRYTLLDRPTDQTVARAVEGAGRGGHPPVASPQSLFEPGPVSPAPHWASL